MQSLNDSPNDPDALGGSRRLSEYVPALNIVFRVVDIPHIIGSWRTSQANLALSEASWKMTNGGKSAYALSRPLVMQKFFKIVSKSSTML